MFNLLQDLCHCGRLVLLLSVAVYFSQMYVNTRMHKIRFIKYFYEKFIEHKNTHQNLYFPLTDSDNGFLNMFISSKFVK